MSADLESAVADLEQRTTRWLASRADPDVADRLAAAEVAAVRERHSHNGFALVSDDALHEYEARWRQDFDRAATQEAHALAADRDRLLAQLDAAIADASTLRGPVQLVAPAAEKQLLAGILDELQVARVRSEVAGLTRAQLADLLTTWRDDEHNPHVRTIEAAVQAGTLARLGCATIRTPTPWPCRSSSSISLSGGHSGCRVAARGATAGAGAALGAFRFDVRPRPHRPRHCVAAAAAVGAGGDRVMPTPTIRFADEFLRVPGPGAGLMPMRLHSAQRRFLEQWDARHPDGTRCYRQGLISWPKQSFKTTTAQICVLADLYGGSGPDREYVVVSTGATQAGDVGFAGLVRFIERAPVLAAATTVYATEIVYEETIREPRTGGTYTQAHRVTALPSQRAAEWHHGRPLQGAWIDEAWALGDRGYALVEAVMPSPTRDGFLLVTSYAGLRQHAKPGNLLWDLFARANTGDPTLCASILQGHGAYADIPHMTAGYLDAQEALLAHVPGRRDRLWKNLWTTSDEGALLTAREVAAAVDEALPVPAVPVPGTRYALGVDLGYSHDWAAAVLTHADGAGHLVVDVVAFWTGTPAKPVDFGTVEAWILATALRFPLAGIWLDQWQALAMKANLTRRLPGVVTTAVTVESSRLDHYAVFLKALFSGRLIRIPREPIELREQLEAVVAVESTARDRLKLQSGTGPGARAFDDLVIALLLSTEGHQRIRTKDGKIYGTTAIDGRRRMVEIDHCLASGVLGCELEEIMCPLVVPGASLLPGCRRCPPVRDALAEQQALLSTGAPYRTLSQLTRDLVPCRFISDWAFRSRMEHW